MRAPRCTRWPRWRSTRRTCWARDTNTVPLRLLNAGNEGSYNDGMDSSITDYLQFYDPDADTAFSLPAWRVENTLYFNAQ